MKKDIFKRTTSIILTLLLLLALTAVFPAGARAEEADYRFITITLHAGDNGYFGDPEIKEKESIQFRGESFSDKTVPDAIDDSYIFYGWATTPDADFPNVEQNITSASMIGSDLYAIWTNECLLYYGVDEGYIIMEDGQPHSDIIMTYQPGQTFRSLTPTPYDEQNYVFDGWYAQSFGQGMRYTEDTPITSPDAEVHAKWKLSAERADYMELDTDYPVEVSRGGKILAFTPAETTVYEIYTKDNEDGDTPAFITMLDADMIQLADSGATDETGNAALSATMNAGQVYFFRLREMSGGYTSFTAAIRRADCAAVTFHANRDEQGDAWFDGDPTVTVKDIPIRYGEDISDFSRSGFELANAKTTGFVGWSVDPDADWKDEYIIVDGDMDVYAVTLDLSSLTLDGNGGYFPLEDNAPVSDYTYVPGSPFVPKTDPRIDDNTIKFAGWSVDPNAEVPDEDIIEGVSFADELSRTLYAVYTDKVLETFDANGGFMLDNPSITIFNSTKGKGHIFYGMVVHHEDERMVALGWNDQNGQFIPYTADIYPFYHVNDDTVYTTVWGYKVILDANGGIFEYADYDRLRVTMEYEGLFSLANVGAQIGRPIHPDPDMEFIGWATTPDAETPDVIDGKTPVKGLDCVYVVWKDNCAPDDPDDVSPSDVSPSDVSPSDVTPDDKTDPDDTADPDDASKPDKPSGSSDPANPSDHGNSGGRTNPAPGTPSRGYVPGTGDQTGSDIWALVFVISLTFVAASAVVCRFSERETNE